MPPSVNVVLTFAFSEIKRGVIFLSEIVSLRLLLATILILGGIGLAIVGKGK